jgi:hypothetical protein
MTTDRPREDALAWELIDHVRDHLTDEERNTAFIHLGVGDYPPVFQCALEAIARDRISLPMRMITHLHGWIADYDRHREFEDVLSRAVGDASPAPL